MHLNQTESCPLCGDLATIHPFSSGLDRTYLRCGRCDLVFVPPADHPSPEEERARYEQHNNAPTHQGYRDFLARLADPIIARLPPGADGLDFGCGHTPGIAVASHFTKAAFTSIGFSCAIQWPERIVSSVRLRQYVRMGSASREWVHSHT